MLTTIIGYSKTNGININSVRSAVRENKIKPIDNEQYRIKGFRGKPFKLSDIEKVMNGYKFNTKKSEVNKNYTKEEILIVLRSNTKSNLWNKEVKSWNDKDWLTFEKLKNNLNK